MNPPRPVLAAPAVKDPAPAARRYATVAIILHWLIAAAILAQIVLAWRMVGRHTPEGFALVQLHKSVGFSILALSLLRLAWRLAKPPPPEPATLARWEVRLAGLVHAAFYLVMIGMPLTGWLMVSASPINIPTRLFGRIPFPHLPGIPELAPPLKAVAHTAGAGGHATLAWLLYGLLGLHVAGVLKHQVGRRPEPVFPRMAPGAVAGDWRDLRLLAVGLGAAGAIAAGALVRPILPPSRPTIQGISLAQLDRDLPAERPAEATAAVAPATAVPTAPVPAEPVRWSVRPGSVLGFATHWGGAPVEGQFGAWTADIRFSPAALDRSRATVSVDMASAHTGDDQRDASLVGGDWFDAASHPKATFTATRFEQTGPDRYVAHGALELRGVRQPLDLRFRLRIDGDRAEMTGQANLDRTVFGVGRGDYAATDEIPAKVSIVVHVSARCMAP